MSAPAENLPPVAAERAALIVDAAIEIESIAIVLQRHFEVPDAEHAFVRGLAIRAEELTSVLLSSVCDDAAAPESLKVRLFGPEWRRARIARGESGAAFGSDGADQ